MPLFPSQAFPNVFKTHFKSSYQDNQANLANDLAKHKLSYVMTESTFTLSFFVLFSGLSVSLVGNALYNWRKAQVRAH